MFKHDSNKAKMARVAVSTAKTTIELNGKLYDARTGRILNHFPPANTKKAPDLNRQTGRVLDGFTKRPAINQPAAKPQPAAIKRHSTASAKIPSSHIHKTLQKSKTLMRPAVKKPAVSKDHAPLVPRISPPAHKSSARSHRAFSVQKSHLIQRFNITGATQTKVIKKSAPLPVANHNTNHLSQKVGQIAQRAEMQASSSLSQFEEALKHASSHLQLEPKNFTKKRFLQRVGLKNTPAHITTVAITALLLMGFFAYQNVPNVQMQIAATRAGLSAGMPGYTPSGFGVAAPIKIEPGKVTLTFSSRTDGRAFSVVQQASNWSSDSLLTNYVTKNNKPYQTYQNNGKTVYIYDNSNATWVDGGIWYQVTGDSSLTSDQLLRIANSL
jgi:hypothetical protein